MVCSDKWVVQLTVDQCKAHNIRHWVFSPGSRNAPFAITVDNDPFFETTVIHDERSAAFFALGMAESIGKPVALCCTSGSAPTNYLPAITEAFYRKIPLVIISADRPDAWTDQGDGQTIKQKHLFRDFTHSVVHLEDGPLLEQTLWKYQRETAILFDKLSHFGPGHINVGLSEPLYQTQEKTRVFDRVISIKHNYAPSETECTEITNLINKKKIMVLCGQMNPNHGLNQQLSEFAIRSNVVVLTENTSNLSSEKFSACIDRSLNKIKSLEDTDFMPDVLITIGGAVVSKRIKSYLRKCKLQAHIHVGITAPEMDTYQQLSHSFVCDPNEFFKSINRLLPAEAEINYFGKWKQLDYEAKDKLNLFKGPENVLVDFDVYQSFFDLLPEGSIIHMANSSVIRYCQLFDPIKNCLYFANRGTSGIDGSTSTAIGFASKNQAHNFFITGDTSFLYDSNAMQLQNHAILKILIINNQGGGIFRIIEGPNKSPQNPLFFEAQHKNTGSFASAFGWHYSKISDRSDLHYSLETFLNHKGSCILEVFTNPDVSPQTLQDFFTFVR